MPAINLAEKLTKFSQYWSPRIVVDYQRKRCNVVKVKSEFIRI